MIDTPADTPDPDIVARNLAERIFSAYLQSATGPMHPQHEQSLLARLAEILRPRIGAAETDMVSAVNAVLDAWEQADPGLRGPRVTTIDARAQTAALAPAP